jgi:cell division protein FtsL
MAIEVHLEKRILNNRIFREADPKSHRDYLIITIFVAIFVLGLFAYGWQHYQWIQYGYRIEEAQKKKAQLLETKKQLRLERATLRDPGRIDKIARGELGMVLPAPGQLVTLSADSPLTIPAPPEATPEQQAAAMAAKR